MNRFAAVGLFALAALPAQAQLLTHKDLSLAIAIASFEASLREAPQDDEFS